MDNVIIDNQSSEERKNEYNSRVKEFNKTCEYIDPNAVVMLGKFPSEEYQKFIISKCIKPLRYIKSYD
jgi:hypothetical protein